jgi:hypothetical protein
MKDFNVRPGTLKVLEENTGETGQDRVTGNNFLNRTPIVQERIARIDRWDGFKLKSF